MVTKGLIKSIDYNSNTCKVRLPLFENASQPSEVCVTAIFAIQPGSINGYKENDVVIVAFDGGSVSSPIVIGKLYLGAAEEAKESRGAIKCDSLSVASEATLPLTTKLISGNFGTNTIDIDGGASSYTSLLDLVKALQKTEENFTKSSIDLDAQIAEIVIEYVSVSVDTTVTNDTELTWQSAIPDWRDGYNIWQKTTYLNRRGQILGTPEIVCLSELTTIASYWLKCSARSHSGSQQNSEIIITAMIKLGSNLETDDTSATLEYRWSDGSTKQPEVENPDKPYELKFINTNEAPFPNADLIITAKRNGVEYESETISFMPLNIPILMLSNESDWIEYDSYGINKINFMDSIESTATVMLNNEVMAVESISWSAIKINGTDTYECFIQQTNTLDQDKFLNATVTVTDIADSVDTTRVMCTAIYKDNLNNDVTLTKYFSVAKNKAGKSAYEVVIDNDFVSIPATSDGTMTDFDWTLTKHKVTALYGDEILACTCSTEDGKTAQDVHLKYTLSGVTLTNTPSASESKTPREIQVASLSGKTGSITYELFKKGTKVASSKFEIIRVDAGEPSTSYSLICSHSNINITANGTISPNEILVGVSKKRGNEAITRINTDNLPLTRESANVNDLYLRVIIGTTNKDILETNDKKTDYKISTASISKNTPITIELVLKGNTPADDIIIDRETISVVEDGKGGDSIEVQQAFCWTDDYLKKPGVPDTDLTTKSVLAAIEKETWTYLTDTPTTNNQATDWKLVYLSTRTITTPGEGSTTNGGNPFYSAWTDPEVFLCKDESAYRVLTTADGLFGYGQGVYYTPAPQRDENGKITGNNTITINGNSYTTGQPISQSTAAEWVAGDPTNRKDDLELYINAEYIKTGAFTVKNGNDILFQAGLDKDNNNKPVVKIAGFDVSPSRMVNIVDEPVIENGITKCSGVGIAPKSGHGCWALWAGPQSGDGLTDDTAYGHDAPFKVGHGGELYTSNISATGGDIGGFDIDNNSLSKTVTKSNETGRVSLSTEKISLGANGECTIDASGNISAANVTINEATIGEWNINSSTVNGAKINTIGTSKIRLESSNEDGGTLFLQGKNNSSFNITIQDGLAATAAQEAITNARLETDANGLSIITSAENAGFRIASPSGTEKTTYTITATMVKNSGRISISSNIGLNDKTVVPVTLYLAAVNIWGTWSFSSVRYNLTKSTSSGESGTSWTKSLGTTKWDYISSSQNNKTESNEARIIVPILNSATGTNYSYGKIVPAVAGLTLGTAEAPWDTIYVKNIVALNTTTSGIASTLTEFKYNDGMSDGQTQPINRDQNGNATAGTVSGKPSTGCFEAGTQISMADGTYKNIEDVQIGDQIYSYNIITKKVEIDTVKQTYSIVQPTDCVILTFADGSTLWTTRTHPFYTTSGWVSLMPYYNYTPKEYKELTEELFEMMTVGQKFYKLTKSGKTKLVKLSRIQYRHGLHKEHKVYNLDVSTNHTFFTNGILGHNAISPSISKLGGTSGGIV